MVKASRAEAATPGPVGRQALLALILLGGALGAQAAPATDTLRRLPVQHDGRVMPFDTLAREMVWTVTGSSTWKGQDPVETVSGWFFDPNTGAEAPMILVGSEALAKAIGLPPATTHASFVQFLRNPKLGELLRSARQAEAERRPLQGVLQDVKKLEQRLLAMQAVGLNEAVRPIPVPGDPNARWGVFPAVTSEGLVRLMEGPRLEGWPAAEAMDREVFYNRLNPVRLS